MPCLPRRQQRRVSRVRGQRHRGARAAVIRRIAADHLVARALPDRDGVPARELQALLHRFRSARHEERAIRAPCPPAAASRSVSRTLLSLSKAVGYAKHTRAACSRIAAQHARVAVTEIDRNRTRGDVDVAAPRRVPHVQPFRTAHTRERRFARGCPEALDAAPVRRRATNKYALVSDDCASTQWAARLSSVARPRRPSNTDHTTPDSAAPGRRESSAA